MTRKRVVYPFLLLIVCSALYISILNTWKWASDFYGLLVLVSLSDKDRSYNPFSRDFFWLSQDMAVFWIKHMEYVYQSCSRMTQNIDGYNQPKIEYAGRFVGLVDDETEPKVFDIVNHLIQRGEPIDAYSEEGLTALQSAILGNSPRLVALLLDAGADPYLPIKRAGDMQGKNSIEFVEHLARKNKDCFSTLTELLRQKAPSLKREVQQ